MSLSVDIRFMNIELSKSPILIIGYKRLLMLQKLIEICVSSGRPIYVWLDGPKNENDRGAFECAQWLRERVSDFPNNFKIKVNAENLGVRRSVFLAISWALSSTDRLIVLEDDVVPGEYFFNFMDMALATFEDWEDIQHVNGWIPDVVYSRISHPSIFLSRNTFGWGWATWKNRWSEFTTTQLDLLDFEPNLRIRRFPGLKNFRLNSIFEIYWKNALKRCKDGLDTWDYQWNLNMWKLGRFAITPLSRFTTNIGVDSEATHTTLSHLKNTQSLDISNFQQRRILEDLRVPDLQLSTNEVLDASIDLSLRGFNPLWSKRRVLSFRITSFLKRKNLL